MQREIVKKLREEILAMQGIRLAGGGEEADPGLGPVSEAFPGGAFPVGIHEFMSNSPENAAATSGFMAGLLSRVSREDGFYLWISNGRQVYPPGLHYFGIRPDRVIFVDYRKPADLSWMIEQSLKCKALAGVVGEISDLDLAQSRRLQLTVEQSRVQCFLHRRNPRMASSIASVCRWKIEPLPSMLPAGMPGVGFPAWEVTLEKVRNGVPGQWNMQWLGERFAELASEKQRTTEMRPSGVVAYERSVS